MSILSKIKEWLLIDTNVSDTQIDNLIKEEKITTGNSLVDILIINKHLRRRLEEEYINSDKYIKIIVDNFIISHTWKDNIPVMFNLNVECPFILNEKRSDMYNLLGYTDLREKLYNKLMLYITNLGATVQEHINSCDIHNRFNVIINLEKLT